MSSITLSDGQSVELRLSTSAAIIGGHNGVRGFDLAIGSSLGGDCCTRFSHLGPNMLANETKMPPN